MRSLGYLNLTDQSFLRMQLLDKLCIQAGDVCLEFLWSARRWAP